MRNFGDDMLRTMAATVLAVAVAAPAQTDIAEQVDSLETLSVEAVVLPATVAASQVPARTVDLGCRQAMHGFGRFHTVSGVIGMAGAGLWIGAMAVTASRQGWDMQSRLSFVAPCGWAFMAMWEFGLGLKLLRTPAQ